MVKCEICSKDFIDKRGLSTHTRIKHAEKVQESKEISIFWIIGGVAFSLLLLGFGLRVKL